ncbi:hypothetical protein E1B28_010069 [Marasmius oreades]|nr:uncharacterized protein E1B28_010069 [Marasmius oreades]KAG7091004.1 hypothetical protein E1B28_010069 [Marasmius oreades]
MFQMSADAQHFFHRKCQKILVKTSRPKSERVIHDNDYDCGFPEEHSHVILSRRARQQTPKPGPNRFLSSLPKEAQKFLLSKPVKMKQVSVNPVENVPLNTDKTLNLTWNLTPDMLKEVNLLLKSTAALSVPGPSYRNQYLDRSARRDSSPLPTEDGTLFDRDFTPLFPRTLRPGTGRTVTKGSRLKNEDSTPFFVLPPPSMKDLPLSPTEMSEFKKEEEELYKQNILLVNGWQTYNFSSPTRETDISAPNSSQGSDQIDELLFSRVSSPFTDPSSVDIPKFDPPVIARCHRIGGARSRPKIQTLGAGKSLAAFLLGMVPQLSDQDPEGTIPPEHTECDSDPVQSTAAQATSFIDEKTEERPDACIEANSSLELQGLYKNLSEDPMNFILNEKLDHNTMMMEAPRLPPPNIHPAVDPQLPAKLSDLVSETKNESKKAVNTINGTYQYGPRILKKARGVQAVTLALSWVSFSVQYRLPTHMEMVGVTTSQLIDKDDNKNGLSREQLKSGVTVLLDSVSRLACTPTTDNTIEVWDRMSHDETEVTTDVELRDDMHISDIILTREERRRLAGIETNDSKMGSAEFSLTLDYNIAGGRDDKPGGGGVEKDDQGITLQKYGALQYDGLETGNSDKENEYSVPLHDDHEELGRPSKRLRLHSATPSVDDSGISLGLDLSGQGRFQVEDRSNECMDIFLYDEARDGATKTIWSLEGHPQDTNDQGMNDCRPESVEIGVGSGPLTVVAGDQYLPENSQFQALCFDSQCAGIPTPNTCLNALSTEFASTIFPSSTLQPEPQTEVACKSGTSALTDNFSPSIETYHISAGIAEFAKLRAKRLPIDISACASDIPSSHLPSDNPTNNENPNKPLSGPLKSIPQETSCQYTRQLSSAWALPTSAHWYLASMSFVQKQALVRYLCSETCGVGIVEREDLNGVDLILDPNTAIIFSNLRALPSECDSLVTLVSEQSWRYTRLLIIFEAYPPSWSLKSTTHDSETLNIFTPPVLKCVKKLRRDLSIAEGCGKKRSACQVCDAFAIDVDEAAKHTRNFGDFAASSNDNDNYRTFWGDRSWLVEGDVSEVAVRDKAIIITHSSLAVTRRTNTV